MYMPDGGEDAVRGLNTSIDFTHIMEIENCSSNMSLELEAYLKDINCKNN